MTARGIPQASVRASGARSVALGGGLTNSVINTGDGNVFVGSSIRLDDAYIDPRSVYERVAIDRFTGREWIDAEIDTFLAERDRGLFILEAPAGLGKTAFMAHLAKSRAWNHHFVETAPGAAGVAPALQSIAAQLILAWSIQPYKNQGVLPLAAGRPEFLPALLAQAAQQRDASQPGAPIVCVVDAIDESAAVAGHNVLGLPKSLPRGVYFVVSQRPVPVSLAIAGLSPHIVRIAPDAANNLGDMRKFLRDSAARPEVADALKAVGRSAADFERTLLDRCRGLWIYLQYVVADIERGGGPPLDLEALPYGVWQYYAEYWSRWRDEPNWHSLGLPLLGALGAVQEDVSIATLSEFGGGLDAAAVSRLLDGPWRPFLTVIEGTPRQYRLYHASLREFLDGRVDVNELTTAQRLMTEELAAATRAAHSRIADRWLTAWGGVEGSLHRLRDSQERGPAEQYGLRHVIAHLAGAKRLIEVKKLLTVEWHRAELRETKRTGWRGAFDRLMRRKRYTSVDVYTNAWYSIKAGTGDIAGYLADVPRAWRAAEEESRRAIAAGQPAASIALEVRCALMTASVGEVASNVGPLLLEALVREKVIEPPAAYAYAQQTTDAGQRMQALLRVAPALSGTMREDAFRAALGAFLELRYHDQPKALAGVPQNLPSSVLEEIVRTIDPFRADGKFHWSQQRALAALVPALPDEMVDKIASSLASGTDRFDDLLLAIVPRLDEERRNHLVAETLKSIRTDRLHPSELRTLLPLARYLSHDLRVSLIAYARERLVRGGAYAGELDVAAPLLAAVEDTERAEIGREVLAAASRAPARLAIDICGPLLKFLPPEAIGTLDLIARQAGDDDLRRSVTVFAARFFVDVGQPEHAFSLAEGLGPKAGRHYPSSFMEALATLAPSPAPYRQRAFRLICGQATAHYRRDALEGFVPGLTREELLEAFAATTGIGDHYSSDVSRIDLLRAIGARDKSEWLLGAADGFGWRSGRALAAVAPFLPADARAKAMSRVRTLKPSSPERISALIGLAASESSDVRSRALVREALDGVQKIWGAGEDDRVELLADVITTPNLIDRFGDADRDDVFTRLFTELASLVNRGGSGYWVRQVMVRIAPKLNEDSLRRALVLVSGMPDPWYVATTFRVLAAYLPEMELRRLALLDHVANTTRYEDDGLSRATANAALNSVPETPDSWTLARQAADARRRGDEEGHRTARASLALTMASAHAATKALAAARQESDLVTRALALVELAPCVDGPDRTNIVWIALATALSLHDKGQRSAMLTAVAGTIEPFTRRAVLRAVATMEGRVPVDIPPVSIEAALRDVTTVLGQIDPSTRSTIDRISVDSATVDTPKGDEAIRLLVRTLDSAPYQIGPGMVMELAHTLSEPDKTTLFRAYLETSEQSFFLPAVARAIAAEFRTPPQALVQAATSAVRRSYDQRSTGPNEQLSVLAALREHVPVDTLQTEWLRLNARFDDDSLNILRTLAQRLSALPPAIAHRRWAELLGHLAGQHREVLLTNFGCLIPLIDSLGERDALVGAFDALESTIRWWP